jgi:alpha-beta hydrolase superfamily lysophospholipase
VSPPVKWRLYLLLAVVAVIWSANISAQAQVVKTYSNVSSGGDLSTALYSTVWQDLSVKPRAAVLAIHGLVLHGGVYDTMASNLARQGIVVVAPDLRGYGHWVSSKGQQEKLLSPVDYVQSHADIVSLAKKIKADYPTIPLFGIGESLGADMVLHLAADCPQTLDGIILSAPAVEHRLFIADILREMPRILSGPLKQIDLAPKIKKYFSDQSDITEATLNDPLVRKKMSAIELLRTSYQVSKCLKYAKNVSPDLPILVFQGTNDQMLKSEAVTKLLDATPSSDETLEWFPNRGHLLLETPFIAQSTMQKVSQWLDVHVNDGSKKEESTTQEVLGRDDAIDSDSVRSAFSFGKVDLSPLRSAKHLIGLGSGQ